MLNKKIKNKEAFMKMKEVYKESLKQLMQTYKNQEEKVKLLESKLVEYEKDTIHYQTLYDFLISSVDETQKPIWTEEHIEEILDNFVLRWKN